MLILTYYTCFPTQGQLLFITATKLLTKNAVYIIIKNNEEDCQ